MTGSLSERHHHTRLEGRLRRSTAAAQAGRAAQPRPRRRRVRRATHRGGRHHAVPLWRQRVPLPHHAATSTTCCSAGWRRFRRARWAIPSLGPSFGRAMDQARLLRRHAFRCAMMLPCGDPRDAAGMEAGLREIADAAGVPLILYLKSEDGFGSDRDAGPRRRRPADGRRRRRRDQVRRRPRRSATAIRTSTACCAASIGPASSAAWASARRSCTCATSSWTASPPAPGCIAPQPCSALFDGRPRAELGARPRQLRANVHAARGSARCLGAGARAAPRHRAGRHRADRPDPAVRLAARRRRELEQLAPSRARARRAKSA